MKFTKIMMASAALAATALTATGAQAATTIGTPIKFDVSGNIIATYIGGIAGYTNTISLEGGAQNFFGTIQSTVPGTTFDLGYFAAGTELIFRFDVLLYGTTYDTFYSGDSARNPDGLAHAGATTDAAFPNVITVGFEDLRGGGDFDYNDANFKLEIAPTAAVPEPATWAMMILGFGLVGSTLRRRQQKVSVSYA